MITVISITTIMIPVIIMMHKWPLIIDYHLVATVPVFMAGQEALDFLGGRVGEPRPQLPVTHIGRQRIVVVEFCRPLIQLGDVATLKCIARFQENIVLRRGECGAGNEQQQ